VHGLRVLADTWVNADVPEAKADLTHATYDSIVVAVKPDARTETACVGVAEAAGPRPSPTGS
jgi:hypothetical protein